MDFRSGLRDLGSYRIVATTAGGSQECTIDLMEDDEHGTAVNNEVCDTENAAVLGTTSGDVAAFIDGAFVSTNRSRQTDIGGFRLAGRHEEVHISIYVDSVMIRTYMASELTVEPLIGSEGESSCDRWLLQAETVQMAE